MKVCSNNVAVWHPYGVRHRWRYDRECRRCAPQPPANVWQPTGLLPRRLQFQNCDHPVAALRHRRAVREISRGLIPPWRETPPVTVRKTTSTPEGCQSCMSLTPRNRYSESLAPLQGAAPFDLPSGGVASRGSAQPPANSCETSGLKTAHRGVLLNPIAQHPDPGWILELILGYSPFLGPLSLVTGPFRR